ncbi:hypothetical protein EVAR_21517_1 [Eumeta japonica]|uniref:Uncharacterized protein n=1 Tax=Eumeta variegata TaxID=151549 RepID=A0A4C1UYZ5_EUMVA|nr:hypothetical protein EVAR_21517_1 [Eumeta japonica]
MLERTWLQRENGPVRAGKTPHSYDRWEVTATTLVFHRVSEGSSGYSSSFIPLLFILNCMKSVTEMRSSVCINYNKTEEGNSHDEDHVRFQCYNDIQ